MKAILPAVFILYILLLVKIILFKGFFFFAVVPTNAYYRTHSLNATYHQHNFVPFRTIGLFLFSETSLRSIFFNLAGNVLLFVPLGILLPLVWRFMRRAAAVVLATACLSLSFEAYQLLTRTGNCDVDDVLLNTLGGFLGFLLFCFWLKKRNRASPPSPSTIDA